MNAEQILEKHWYNYKAYFPNNDSNLALEAMETYARDRGIAFGEWLVSQHYDTRIMRRKTTEELWEIFNNQI